MNPEVKTAWLAALRSGEYKQGTGQLRDDDTYCCLGVLCDLHAKATGTTWGFATEVPDYLGASFILPHEVASWAGVSDCPGVELDEVPGGVPHFLDNRVYLPHLNDEAEFTFEEIADLIESQL